MNQKESDMEDQHRTNDKVMNASLEYEDKLQAENAARPIIPDNCIVRNGKVVGVDQRKATYAGEKTSFIPSRN